jgi:protein phosphatase 1L
MQIISNNYPITWNQEDSLCSIEWHLKDNISIRSLPYIIGAVAHTFDQALKFQLPDNQIAYVSKEEYFKAILQHANLEHYSGSLKRKMEDLTSFLTQKGPIILRTKETPSTSKAIDLSNELFSEISPAYRRGRWIQKIPATHPNNVQVILSDEIIQEKLDKELSHAQAHMEQQIENSFFSYIPLPSRDDSSPVRRYFHGNHEIGIASSQGLRKNMEDKHIIDRFSVPLVNGTEHLVEMFAVLDGHGGNQTVSHVEKHLKQRLQEALYTMASTEELSDTAIWNALKLTFVGLDEECKAAKFPCGTTATVALILGGNLWVANVGDSRAILQDLQHGTIQLSEDFTASTERNKKGIIKRGGVFFRNQIASNSSQHFVSVGRSIGSGINPRPKITKIPLDTITEGSFLILESDGIHGSANHPIASSKQLGNMIQEKAALNPLKHVSEDMLYSAFHAGSQDNLTLMIIRLGSPQYASC